MQDRYNSSQIITEEENWIVATDVSSGVSSQGKTIEEAKENLKEAVNLYYDIMEG